MMKITDQYIIDSAKRQRDLDNEQLHVCPWTANRRHFRIPLWLTAVPAAAIIGFLFGAYVHRPADTSATLTAFTDTVYVTHEVQVPQTPDTIIRYVATRQAKHKKPEPTPATGRSIDQDDIDYSMLVLN